MANVNYTSNPDPRGNWEPQGFLAGFNYQDRLNDYNKQRDLANMNSQLSNEGLAARNTDFVHGQGARDMGYTQQEGASRNAIALQPDQLKLSTMQLQGDIGAQPGMNEAKVYESMQALPNAQKQQALKDTLTTATVLRGLPQDADPALATGILDKLGIDTSRWKGKDPQRVMKEFSFLRSLDPEVFKHFNKMEELKSTEQSAERIHSRTNDTSRYVADRAFEGRKVTMGNSRAAFNNALDEQATSIMEKDPKDWDAHDHAVIKTWQTLRAEPFNKAGAGAQGKTDTIKNMLDVLKNPNGQQSEPNSLPQMNNKPKGPSKMLENPTSEEYNSMKDGDQFIYNGKTYTKGQK